jgi:hypothetical protein
MRQYSVYVVELGNDQGPRINPIEQRVYVGYTEKSPEQRLAQHKFGGRLKRQSVLVSKALFEANFADFNNMAVIFQ